MKKIKAAIIGAGNWGSVHADIYSEYDMVELVAVCDMKLEKALKVAKKHGIDKKNVYEDHKRMLESEDIDVVSIVTPDFLHKGPAVDCASYGKHILLEKPLATTERDVFEIYTAVKKNNVRAMVDLHNRWNPPFAKMKDMLDTGAYGEPYNAYIRLNDIKSVATEMLPWAQRSSILWFLGTHSLDTLRWIFDDEVKRVYSVARAGILKELGVDTVDVYQTILEFENGGIATMENGWITPDTNPNVNDFRCNVTCTKGIFELDLSNHDMLRSANEKGFEVPDMLVKNFVNGKAMGFAYQSIRHFIDCIINEKPFNITLEDAANVSLTILKVFESVEKGMPVDIALPDWESIS